MHLINKHLILSRKRQEVALAFVNSNAYIDFETEIA